MTTDRLARCEVCGAETRTSRRLMPNHARYVVRERAMPFVQVRREYCEGSGRPINRAVVGI